MQGAQGDMRGHNSAAYGEELRAKRTREQTTHDFFGAWNSTTCGMSLEEKGAYAELSGLIIGHGKPVTAEMAMRVLGVNVRKWRRLVQSLAEHGAIVVSGETVMVPALQGRLYKTGYSYIKSPIPSSLRWEVFRRDEYECLSCGSKDDLTVDHIDPEKHGGRAILQNLQTLCRSCNSKKGAR